MSVAELFADLMRLNVRLEAHGDRLRYSPRSAVTPDLADLMKTHKDELLAILCGPDAVVIGSNDPVFLFDEDADAEWDTASRV